MATEAHGNTRENFKNILGKLIKEALVNSMLVIPAQAGIQ
jgi:hypothetical protein